MELLISELDVACMVAHEAYGDRGVVLVIVTEQDTDTKVDIELASMPRGAFDGGVDSCG